jgi:hypothetical protein
MRLLIGAIAEAKATGELRATAAPEDVALAYQALSTALLIAAIRSPAGIRPAKIRASMRAVFFDPLFGPAPGTNGAARPPKRKGRR